MMELSSARDASNSVHSLKPSHKPRDWEQRKAKDDSVHAINTSMTPQAFNPSKGLTKTNLPGCNSEAQMPLQLEDYIQSTPESSETSTLSSSTSNNRSSLNRRLTTFYKPLKRYFNQVDQKGSRESLTEYKDHRRPKSASFSSSSCQFQGVDSPSRQQTPSPTSLHSVSTLSSHVSGSFKVTNATSSETIRNPPFELGSLSHTPNDEAFSPAPFPSSATVVEGIHPSHDSASSTSLTTPVASGSHSRSRTVDDRSTATYIRQSSAHSRFSSIASFGSNRSSRIPFTRPLSGFLSKSTELLFIDQGFGQNSIEEWSRSDKPGGSVLDSPLKEGTLGESRCSRTKETRFNGKKTWSKLLSGYGSPMGGSSSPSFFNRRGTKTPATTPSSPCTPRDNLLFPDQRVSLQRDERTKHKHESLADIPLHRIERVSRERSCSCPPATAVVSETTRPESVSVCKTKGTPISSFVVSTILQMLLLYICPPTDLIAVGGTGMLFVYTVLMAGLACVSWMLFDNDVEKKDKVVNIIEART